MALDLFAGIAVADYPTSLAWYARLLGAPPTFMATETEAVWELAGHRWVYIVERPEHAGHSMQTILVDDLDAFVAQLTDRGIEPSEWEHNPGGMRKAIYVDPDGNEFGVGGGPTSTAEPAQP